MDPFSEQCAKELFDAFPAWRSSAREERDTDGSSYLVIEIAPPPEARVERALIVHTDNDEVTVGFDFYHSHCDSCFGDDDHFGTTAAVPFIRQLLTERIAVVSWWFDDAWRGSAQIEAGSVPTPHAGIKPFNRVRVRSWKGTLNADISA
jgi:hypothetical protein